MFLTEVKGWKEYEKSKNHSKHVLCACATNQLCFGKYFKKYNI